MIPPVENPDGDTDQDSENEVEPSGKIEHLPGRLIRAGGEGRIVENFPM